MLCVCLWMRCPSQSSQSSVHLVACRPIWKVFPQLEMKGGGEGQKRLVEYPGDLGVPWGVRCLRGPRCGWHQTTVCHAASPAGSTWHWAASFLSAAFTAAYVKHVMTSFSSAAQDPLLIYIAVDSRGKSFFQVSKNDHVAYLLTVTVTKDAFLLCSLFHFPDMQTALTMASAINAFCRDIHFSFCVLFLFETQYQSQAFITQSQSTCCTSEVSHVHKGLPFC